MAEEARNATPVGDNGTCSDGRSRKNECGNGVFITKDRVGTM